VAPARKPSASTVPVSVVKNMVARVPASAMLEERSPDNAKYSVASPDSNALRAADASSVIARARAR
jgi:hypothetical protein